MTAVASTVPTSNPISWWRAALSVAAIGGTMVALDVAFIGLIAKPIYDELGSLKRTKPSLLAAGLFYAMYSATTFVYAVKPAANARAAARRAAGLGFVAYATYELTSAAVIRDWPTTLVPIDTAWGVILSSIAAAAGRAVLSRTDPKR